MMKQQMTHKAIMTREAWPKQKAVRYCWWVSFIRCVN